MRRVLLLSALSCACDQPQPAVSRPAPPRVAPRTDATAPEVDPRSTEPQVRPGTVGVSVATMSTDGGAAEGGLLGGYIRFVHLGTGVGPVRFFADSPPQYESSHVTQVVQPGTSSGYLPARGVPHLVRVEAAEPDAAVLVVAPLTSDVYNGLGCTVALLGRALTARLPPGRDAGPEALHLRRYTDLPQRGDGGVALIRFVNGVVMTGALDLREGEGTVYPAIEPGAYTGLRRLSPGPHTISLAPTDGGTFGHALPLELPADEAHSVWLYGVAPTRRAPGEAHALLTRDLPPRVSTAQ